MSSRRSLALRPVHSEKEEITWSNLSQNASATQTITIVDAVNSPTTAGQVEIGATVRSIFFEINIAAETITNAKVVHWLVQINPQGLIGQTPSVYDSTGKSHILKRGMEMLPKDVGTVFKRIFVVRIPPRLRRMSDGTSIEFRYIASSTETINCCGIAIYKQFN